MAVIDSGIGPSNDLVGKVVYEQQFIQGNKQDAYGHGTHVAGINAGGGNDSKGAAFFRTFQGVAQGVSLIDLQVLDQNGAGSDSAVIAAIQQAIALKSKYNIRVINLSLGRPVLRVYRLDRSAWRWSRRGRRALWWWCGWKLWPDESDNYLWLRHDYGTGQRSVCDHGGGHEGHGDAIAERRQDRNVQFEGPTLYDMVAKPDLVAPGNLIDSTRSQASNMGNNNPQAGIPMNLYQNGNNTGNSTSYIQLSGTSMATRSFRRRWLWCCSSTRN